MRKKMGLKVGFSRNWLDVFEVLPSLLFEENVTPLSFLLQALTVLAVLTSALYYVKRFKFSVLKSRKLVYAPKNYSDSQKYRIEN